jgi:hypothetical protein
MQPRCCLADSHADHTPNTPAEFACTPDSSSCCAPARLSHVPLHYIACAGVSCSALHATAAPQMLHICAAAQPWVPPQTHCRCSHPLWHCQCLDASVLISLVLLLSFPPFFKPYQQVLPLRLGQGDQVQDLQEHAAPGRHLLPQLCIQQGPVCNVRRAGASLQQAATALAAAVAAAACV